jgi:hypothetical protein
MFFGDRIILYYVRTTWHALLVPKHDVISGSRDQRAKNIRREFVLSIKRKKILGARHTKKYSYIVLFLILFLILFLFESH